MMVMIMNVAVMLKLHDNLVLINQQSSVPSNIMF